MSPRLCKHRLVLTPLGFIKLFSLTWVFQEKNSFKVITWQSARLLRLSQKWYSCLKDFTNQKKKMLNTSNDPVWTSARIRQHRCQICDCRYIMLQFLTNNANLTIVSKHLTLLPERTSIPEKSPCVPKTCHCEAPVLSNVRFARPPFKKMATGHVTGHVTWFS